MYQIGTVSSLTGIDAHTIRAWERRYGAIKPIRSDTGRRLYADETIERLQLLKGLVDCSEAISQIAPLSDDVLRERLAKLAEHEGQSAQRGAEAEEIARPPRVALLAPSLQMQIEMNAQSISAFDVCVREADADRFRLSLRSKPCEVAIVELESLGKEALAHARSFLGAAGSPLLFILYRFASRSELARLARAGASLVRTPIRLEALNSVVHDQLMITRAKKGKALFAEGAAGGDARKASWSQSAGAAASVERRFDDAQLARLIELTTAVDCECPNHLSSLISGLVAFEEYSRNCESRDEVDAAQHRQLAEGTAEARARMEQLLLELCEHEGIRV